MEGPLPVVEFQEHIPTEIASGWRRFIGLHYEPALHGLRVSASTSHVGKDVPTRSLRLLTGLVATGCMSDSLTYREMRAAFAVTDTLVAILPLSESLTRPVTDHWAAELPPRIHVVGSLLLRSPCGLIHEYNRAA